MNETDSKILKILNQSHSQAEAKSQALSEIERISLNASQNFKRIIRHRTKQQFNGHISERIHVYDAIKRDILP